jgi:hypothetical protein
MLRLGKAESSVDEKAILPVTVRSPRPAPSTSSSAESSSESSESEAESRARKKTKQHQSSSEQQQPPQNTQPPVYEDFMVENEPDLEQAVGKILEKYFRKRASVAGDESDAEGETAASVSPPSKKSKKEPPTPAPKPPPPPASSASSKKSKSGGSANAAEKKALARVKKTIGLLHKSLEGL